MFSRASVRSVAGVVFVVAAIVGMVTFLASRWSEVRRGWVWDPLAIGGAVVLAGLALTGWAIAWTIVVPVAGQRRIVAQSFVVSQLGKYVPGGVLQVAGQIAMSSRTGLSKRLLACRFIGFSLLLACGAAVVSAVGAFTMPTSTTVRLLGVLTIGLLAVTIPSFSHRVVPALSRNRLSPDSLWHRSSPLPAVAICACGFVCYSLGFAVLLRSTDSTVSIAAAMAAFCLAWIAGFLVVILPAGLGVREAVLVALLSRVVPSATVLAIALVYRVLILVTEVAGSVATTVLVRRPLLQSDAVAGQGRLG